MRHLLRRKPSPGVVLGALALLIALGGTSYAAVGALPRASVGTLQLQTGAVTSIKVANGTLRRLDFAPGTLLTGPAGPVGPQGPTGPAGATGPAGTVDTTQFYKKTETDARYLRRTISVVSSTTVAAGDTKSIDIVCGAGYEALSGGTDTDEASMRISASAPLIQGTRTFSTSDGQKAAATGWRATVTNGGASSQTVKLAVICAPFST
jgi:hypothetical protein